MNGTVFPAWEGQKWDNNLIDCASILIDHKHQIEVYYAHLEQEMHVCNYSGDRIATDMEARRHMIREVLKEWECGFCDGLLDTYKSLCKHVMEDPQDPCYVEKVEMLSWKCSHCKICSYFCLTHMKLVQHY